MPLCRGENQQDRGGGGGQACERFTKTSREDSGPSLTVTSAGEGPRRPQKGAGCRPRTGSVAKHRPLPQFRDSDATLLCSSGHTDSGGDRPGDRGGNRH